MTAGRGIAIAAPIAYAIALATAVATWGLPLARDQLFFWLGLGLLAFSVGSWRTWGTLVLHWLPLYGLLVGYDFLRGAVSVPEAQAHLAPQLDLDELLVGPAGPTVWLQQHLWEPTHLHVLDIAVWAVYMTHFFVVWIVAAVLWRRSHQEFRRYATLVVLVTLGAFVTYWLYPAQPPWMAARDGRLPPVDRIVPEVWDRLGVRTVSSVYEDDRLVNTVAAMPSLHAAYPAMLLAVFWRSSRRARALVAAYALAMAFTLVYSGEHFVTDVLAGWALVAVACGMVAPGARLAARRPRVSPLPHASRLVEEEPAAVVLRS